jgi:hypothetical protein
LTIGDDFYLDEFFAGDGIFWADWDSKILSMICGSEKE